MELRKQPFRMQTSISMILLTSILLLSVLNVPVVRSQMPNPNEVVVATLWGPKTVDPAWCYDTSSEELIMNVYETLIGFDVNWTQRDTGFDGEAGQAGKVDQFVGRIADDWVVPGDGRWGTAGFPAIHPSAPNYTDATYYFHIREGIPWHNASYGNVTPPDVEYTFERWMGFDRSGGPAWMIYEPLLEAHGANWDDPEWAHKIDDSVQRNDTSGWVWFNLASPDYPPTIFMQTIAQSWASIIDQNWAAEHDCWPGIIKTNADMEPYYDPPISPLDDYPSGTGAKVEMGSGPYTLEEFDILAQWYRLQYFPNYWIGWPAPNCDDYIRTVTVLGIPEWNTRKILFLSGEADFCYVPLENIHELVLNWPNTPEVYPPGIDCLQYTGLHVEAIFPVMNISTDDNPYMGTPQDPNDYESGGIPPDFFSNVHVRRAFAYCFNYTQYINEVFLKEGQQPATPHIEGLSYFDYIDDVGDDDLSPPDTLINPGGPWNQPTLPNGSGPLPPVPQYYRNLLKAEYEFKNATDYEGNSLWDEGFKMGVPYDIGNTSRFLAISLMEEALEAMNPRFHLWAVGVEDWETYLEIIMAHKAPFFIMGFSADHSDPHMYVHPFMHSEGFFAQLQSYQNATVDALIDAGVSTMNNNSRIMIYNELGHIYHDDAVSIPTIQAFGRHWERDWIEGWYWNPLYSGRDVKAMPGNYYYHLWKAEPTSWYEIDLSAEATITPTTMPPELQVYDGEYRLAGSTYEQNYSIHVQRVDANTMVMIVYGVIDLRRQNASDMLDFIIAEDDQTSEIFWLTPGDEYTYNCTYDETSTAEEGTWDIVGYVNAISGSGYDNVTANNFAPDGWFTAYELVGDIDGSGEVDIFDAIQLAGAFGSSEGEDRWNENADLNSDGTIDIFDAILLAGSFGDSIP